jgi:hypothetical protein
VLRCQPMPLLQLLLAATGVVDCYIVGVFEEIVQAWTWLHSTPAMGADGITASRQRETGTAALSADMGRRNQPGVAASQCPSPCVGLDWRKVSESDRAVLLEEDVRWERGYHTRGVSLAGPRYGSKDTSEARAVRTACGGIVESAPESGSSVPHSQRARKSQGLRGTSVSG